METFEEVGNSCSLISFENDQILKQPMIHFPKNVFETSLPENLLTGFPDLSNSVSSESDSSHGNARRAIFTIHLPSAQILVVNSAACQMLSFNSDELCSMKLVDLIEDSQKHKLSNLYEKFLKSESDFNERNGKLLDFQKKNGDTLAGLIYLKRTENPGRCLTIVKPLERKICMLSLDQNGNILSCDEQLASVFYYDPSEIVGMSVYNLLPEIKFSRSEGHWKDNSKQHITGKARNGEAFPVSLTICSGNSNAEEFKILIRVYTNLSALIILDKRLLITYFNKNFLKLLLGFSKKDIINQPIFNLIPAFCKNTGFEKIKRDQHQSDILNDANDSYWYEKNEPFECWGESSTIGEYVPGKSSCSSFPFGNFTHPSKQNDSSASSPKAENEMDHCLKTLFKHKKANEVNEEQKISNYSYKSFPNGDHFEEKISLSPVINKIGKNNSELFNNILAGCSAINPTNAVQEGKFFGFAQHSDGNCIPIKYVVKTVAVNEESYYSVWFSKNSFRFPDKNKRFNTSMVYKFNSSSIDSSLPKDSSCSEECTRPSTASLISQCDENLTAGDYSQHYTNIRQIGKGAFGYVKMAFRNSDGLLVVTKFIKKQKINVRSWVFHSNLNMKIPLEISLLTALHHPNIVKVLDVFHNDSFVQLVMEKHGAGFDLFEFINRGPNCDEKLKSYIFRQIISAVYYLDSLGILHRDIKDENVIINERFEIKLIDFGSATFIPPNENFSKFYGTVEYCSPEVLQGNTYKGPELEIWALGVTLYILTFGDNPFHNVEEAIKGQFSIPFPISKELDNLLNQMLDKNVETRISIDKVVEDSWVNQPVCIDNYRFEEVVQCSDEEAYPPKYVHEIDAEDFYAKDSRTDSNLLGDTNNSYGSLQNFAEIDDLDAENFQQAQKSYRLELSESKVAIPSLLLSSTPMRWRKDRLSKSASGVPENFKQSSSLSDCSCECRDFPCGEKESHSRNDHSNHFRSTSSSENECSGIKEGIILPSFRDICVSDLEMRLKRCNLVEEVNPEARSSASANELHNESEVYELVNENGWRQYLGVEENSGNECFSPN